VPEGQPAGGDNAIWNGGFEAGRLLGWGLDWRVRPTWGVDVTLDPVIAAHGTHSLRLTFNSFPTLDFAGVLQFVPVEPGREYRLRALAKAHLFTTSSGLKLEVVSPGDDAVLAETRTISGTTADWVPLETRVQIPAGTSLVLVRLRREKAAGPEGNRGGKVWGDEGSLRWARRGPHASSRRGPSSSSSLPRSPSARSSPGLKRSPSWSCWPWRRPTCSARCGTGSSGWSFRPAGFRRCSFSRWCSFEPCRSSARLGRSTPRRRGGRASSS